MQNKIRTLYDYFPDYSFDDVNKVIDKLAPKAKEILKIKFGDDYKSLNEERKLTKQESFFYNNILRLIIKRLREYEENKKNLYEYFKDFMVEEIELAVLNLNKKSKDILVKGYSNNFFIPSNLENLTNREKMYFFNNVISQINFNLEKERIQINNSDSIYLYFKKYSKYKIDELIYYLPNSLKDILQKKYGENYEGFNNHDNLSLKELKLLYETIASMKYQLVNGFSNIRPLYDFFPSYSMELVDIILCKLSKKRREILGKIYSNGYSDLGNIDNISKPDINYFYQNIITNIADKLQKNKLGSTIYKTIYEYFKDYSEEEVDRAILELKPKQKAILIKKYGQDFKNPIYKNHITSEDEIYLGTNVRKAIRRIMDKNRTFVNTEPTIYEYFSNYTEEEVDRAYFLLKNAHKQILFLKYGESLKEPERINTLSSQYEIRFRYILKVLEKTLLQIRNKEAIISYNKLIYDYFPKYSMEEVDEAISTLPLKAKQILNKKYGNDLKNPPVVNTLDSKDLAYFSSNLLVILRKRLENKQKGLDVVTGRPAKLIYEYFKNYSELEVDEIIKTLPERSKNILFIRYGNDLKNPKPKFLTTDDKAYFRNVLANIRVKLKHQDLGKKEKQKKVLMLLKELISQKLISNFNNMEINIILLYFVYRYSFSQLSKAYSLNQDEIIEIINKFLALYQDMKIKDLENENKKSMN